MELISIYLIIYFVDVYTFAGWLKLSLKSMEKRLVLNENHLSCFRILSCTGTCWGALETVFYKLFISYFSIKMWHAHCILSNCTLLTFKVTFTSSHLLEYAIRCLHGRVSNKKNDLESDWKTSKVAYNILR